MCSVHKKAKCGYCPKCQGCRKCPSLPDCKGGNHIGTHQNKIAGHANTTTLRNKSTRASKPQATHSIAKQSSGTLASDVAIEAQELREEVVSDYDTLTVATLLRLLKIKSAKVNKVKSTTLSAHERKLREWGAIMVDVVLNACEVCVDGDPGVLLNYTADRIKARISGKAKISPSQDVHNQHKGVFDAVVRLTCCGNKSISDIALSCLATALPLTSQAMNLRWSMLVYVTDRCVRYTPV